MLADVCIVALQEPPMTTVLGRRGSTLDSYTALEKLAVAGAIEQAIMTDFQGKFDVRLHGFILRLKGGEVQVIADGFSSGYNGGGVRGLMACIRLIRGCGIEVRWVQTEAGIGDDLFDGKLSEESVLRLIDTSKPLVVETIDRNDESNSFAKFNPETGTLVMVM
jgi:hypothetical protein